EALKLLPLGVGNVRLHINPQDFEQVKALRERHEETWRIVEDAALQPGGCRVETEYSRIDATVETRISQIMAQLLDQVHEQVLNPAEPDMSVDLDAPDAP
ncbi:MAG: FliH/SctL family protein, partial [Pseudomonas veronii]